MEFLRSCGLVALRVSKHRAVNEANVIYWYWNSSGSSCIRSIFERFEDLKRSEIMSNKFTSESCTLGFYPISLSIIYGMNTFYINASTSNMHIFCASKWSLSISWTNPLMSPEISLGILLSSRYCYFHA